jgi:hypothetical protein
MPPWTVEEILSVHIRMHAAEGALFRGALAAAAQACGLNLTQLPEKQITTTAAEVLQISESALLARLAAAGKVCGTPWGKDQKDACIAALTALRASSKDN